MPWDEHLAESGKRFLAPTPEEYPYSSANPSFQLDPVPRRLKPISSAALPQD
jgi:hypothetical protein